MTLDKTPQELSDKDYGFLKCDETYEWKPIYVSTRGHLMDQNFQWYRMMNTEEKWYEK